MKKHSGWSRWSILRYKILLARDSVRYKFHRIFKKKTEWRSLAWLIHFKILRTRDWVRYGFYSVFITRSAWRSLAWQIATVCFTVSARIGLSGWKVNDLNGPPVPAVRRSIRIIEDGLDEEQEGLVELGIQKSDGRQYSRIFDRDAPRGGVEPTQ